EMYEIFVIQSRNRYIKRAFSSYVPPALVKRLIHEPGGLNLKGEKREITLLFSDIRGFTSISEKLSPEMLGMLLNDYLGAMTNILFKEKGTLDKYIGDAVMAIYNAPLDDPDHPILAVRTAITMQSTLKELNKRYQKQFNVDMRIGIGIHTGKAIVGNFGSPRRFNYTAMGDAVNLASRLEGQTKYYGVEIIISEGTLEGLGGAFMVRKLDKIRVKGKLEPVEIFQLFSEGATPENTALAEKFDMAMESYYKGEFSTALNMLLDIEKFYPTDRPTQLMMERCQKFIEKPPEQWDGVHTATSK
ncbi:MAG: adenylate/guanylate cyclase domain-containing protein, partial [Gammaproteobacteria bacterium]|nr:adenylate/guanylate cyclase domain-containing protein [Gammaproteobacteria bacterium]